MKTKHKHMRGKDITRRTAIKLMGGATLTALVAPAASSTLASCTSKRKHRVILYFTGTGNSLYVARQLAGHEGETLSIPQLMKAGQYSVEADEIGLVYPVYGHMPPNMVRKFIQQAHLTADYKFAVLTYGNRKCSAVEIWDEVSSQAGCPFDYISTMNMVDNWLPNFDMNKQMKVDKHIPEQLSRISADINSARHWHEPVSDVEREQHQGFLERSGIDPKVGFVMQSERCFTVGSDCISCGICTYVCPRGNYRLSAQGATSQGDCEFCFACIQNCPQKAIQFARSTDGSWPDGTEKNPQARYRNEHISLYDLKQANDQTTPTTRHA